METLHTLVLGAAAGGGLPQWNCGCYNCEAARSGSDEVVPQTQSSLAVSANGEEWAILNTSPDIRQQIIDNRELHPTGIRETPIKSVLLTNADIDHIAGLLILREKQAFTVFATAEILNILKANPIFDALDRTLVSFQPIALEEPFELLPGLSACVFSVPGKVPLYLEGDVVETDLQGEQTVGVEIITGEKRCFYIPGCAALTDSLEARLNGADLLFFDGTVFTDNEMAEAGTGTKTGRRMGHMAISGEEGTIKSFQKAVIGKKVFVHLNNTNPVWRKGGAERQFAQEAGWQIGFDGLKLSV